jgi:hypothetical protein
MQLRFEAGKLLLATACGAVHRPECSSLSQGKTARYSDQQSLGSSGPEHTEGKAVVVCHGAGSSGPVSGLLHSCQKAYIDA